MRYIDLFFIVVCFCYIFVLKFDTPLLELSPFLSYLVITKKLQIALLFKLNVRSYDMYHEYDNIKYLGSKVLVVDDEISILAILTECLKDSGFSVIKAMDGLEAVNILMQDEIDYVITDFKMPRMDGLELIKWIRTNYSKDMKIILLTGSVSAGLEYKVDDNTRVIYKPFDLNQILETLSHSEINVLD